MTWFADAPANLALIKYMGKTDPATNTPSNPSLSYTLDKLQSFVQLEHLPAKRDFWEALDLPGGQPFELSDAGQQRYLAHLNFLKQHFGFEGYFKISSCNNFPQSSGLASSASSFAALTKAAVKALCDLTEQERPSVQGIAMLSRQGSGSSCRSFFNPWALWDDSGVKTVELPYPSLIHQVIVVDHGIKAVSSSEAHLRVATSPNFQGRPQRAIDNLDALMTAFQQKDWGSAYQIVFDEFMDMHQLFETAEQAFKYITAQSMEIIDVVKQHWQQNNDGPLITMDAGPNVHLLYRPDQADMALQIQHDHFVGNFDVL